MYIFVTLESTCVYIYICICTCYFVLYLGFLLFCSQFQQEYQTFFHHSFRVSDYLSKEDAGLRDLLNVCQGIKVSLSLSLSLSTHHSHVALHVHIDGKCDAW